MIDVILVAFSTVFGYLLRFNFIFEDLIRRDFYYGVIVNCLGLLIAISMTKSHAGIVRYTGVRDGVRLFNTLLLSLLFVSATNLIYYYNFSRNLIPYSVILIAFLASFLFLFQYRLLIKNIFSYYKSTNIDKERVAIFGAGQLGIVTKQVLENNNKSDLKVVAFLENGKHKIGKVIDGTPIHDAKTYLFDRISTSEIDQLIIAIDDLSIERKNEIVDTCLKYDIKVRSVPKIEDWVKGELSLRQIKKVNIEDLLGRESIELNNESLSREILGKKVCITGAAGSIGSELVRQVKKYNPSVVVLIDQAESPLYEIERELSDPAFVDRLRVYVADITDKERIESIFNKEKPDLIFHAAAYKHVPLMEENVVEAVKCNVFGTKNLADLAVKFEVEKFVMVSTDKAVNPTNVMGCSKRIAEIYVQSLNNSLELVKGASTTQFVTTRFGNVLGSNGSVIPFFKKQISQGGPLTVTHPDITRYFMTITEACQLVLEAGAMGKGGEIFIFDMGKSVKIVELAKKMIKLSGLELNKDIEIVYTGLRQGEKLYEELLSNSENTIATHHKKIMIAKVKRYEMDDVEKSLEALTSALMDKQDSKYFELVRAMKNMVPEYKSNSSVYQVLDN